jgi:hypothetical protein
MSALEGAENIDDLMKNSRLQGRLRVDYLAFRRDVIIEQKSFEVDLDTKIEPLVIQFFSRARNRPYRQDFLCVICRNSCSASY